MLNEGFAVSFCVAAIENRIGLGLAGLGWDSVEVMDKSPTKLDYYDDMWKLQSSAALLSHFNDGRHALILDRTIFYPQGGGQPADTGFLRIHGLEDIKFVVSDVRSKDGIVSFVYFINYIDHPWSYY